MENYQFAQASKPSVGAIHGVECAPSESVLKMQYVRTGQVDRDKAFTDVGLFQLATEGIPISSNGELIVGELWATYNVRLSRANLYSSLLGYNIQQCYRTITVLNDVPSYNAPTSWETLPLKIEYIPAGLVNKALAAPFFKISWPQTTILGTYQVTVNISYPTGTTLGLCPYLGVSDVASAAKLDYQATKGGAPFYATKTLPTMLPDRTGFAPRALIVPDCAPTINGGTSGVGVGPSTCVNYGTFGPNLTDLALVYNQECTTQFAINAPGLVTPSLSICLVDRLTGIPYLGPIATLGTPLTFLFNITQINAEVSNTLL